MEILVNDNSLQIKKGEKIYQVIVDFDDVDVEDGYITNVNSIMIEISENDNKLVSLIIYDNRKIEIITSNIDKILLDVLLENIQNEFIIIPNNYYHLNRKLIKLLPIFIEITT